MPTVVITQMTSQGLLIPRAAIQEWMTTELEAIKGEAGIVIRPKTLSPQQERILDMHILEEAGLLLPVEPLPVSLAAIPVERQAELAHKFSVGKPLSEIIIEEREDRA
ncbi:MAG: hypothetical protein JW850_14690 [Thermoflexales bacterium]|nr:hypothetical protein [Thermoflexales bacterium]